MGGGLHFLDLHYKGVRILKGWRHLLYRIFLTIYGVFTLSIWIASCWIGGLSFKLWDWQAADWKTAGMSLLWSAGFGAILFVAVLFLFRPVWDYIANLQRLCRLIYAAKWYITNDIITPNMFQDKSQRVKREVAYFPAFYYRKRNGLTEVTVRLDGGKFQLAGEVDRLGGTLEELLVLNIFDITERLNYRTFCFISDASRLRLGMEDVAPEGYAIPLMEGIFWDIAKVPHALINGGTGGGKTFFVNILLRAFILMGAELYLCDPKNSSLADYNMILPNVAVLPEGIIENVRRCVDIMMGRQASIKGHENYVSGWDFTHYDLPPVILVLDEFVAFADGLEKKKKDEFKTLVNQIVLKGREAGVFVILATQRADAEFLSGNTRDQLGLRVTLGEMSPDGYRMAFGAKVLDQPLKNKGERGRGYVYMPGLAFIQELYSPLVPEGYDFIKEAGKLLGVEPCASSRQGAEASTDSNGQEGGEAAYVVKEVVYGKE